MEFRIVKISLFIVFARGSIVNGMICPAVNENSTVTEQTLGWMCEVINWRNALSDLKLLVEKECSVSDEDEDWRSVFECPDFSDINCVNESSLQNETDSFNCSISYCGDGNYVDQTFLQPIWIHHHNANRNFMIILQRNFSDCIEIAGSNLNVTCRELDNNATEAEMSEAWMCEYINWRNALAEWRERVKEECSVNDDDSKWQSAFDCPDFSATQCFGGAPKLNETDLLNCSISFCEDGNYSDEQPLRTVSKQQFDIREFLTTNYITKDLRCAIRKTGSTAATSTVTQSSSATETIATTTGNAAEAAATSAMTTTHDMDATATEPVDTTLFASDSTVVEVESTSYEAIGWTKSGNLLYKCFTDARSDYQGAKESCGIYGGRLAAKVLRNNDTQNDIIANACVSVNYFARPWIGLDDLETEGEWRWSDGETMDNNSSEWILESSFYYSADTADCAFITDARKLILYSEPCNYYRTYICEIDIANSEFSTDSTSATNGVELTTTYTMTATNDMQSTTEYIPEPTETEIPDEQATAQADVTTAEPDITTTEPDITIAEPDITTVEPDISTTEPDITTTEPATMTVEDITADISTDADHITETETLPSDESATATDDYYIY